MEPEVTVSSWSHLQDELFADSWNEDLARFRSRNAFRGLSDASYPLYTTLMRLGGSYVDLERHLLRNFRKYAHRTIVERDSLWHWLSVAKHYGLPARLLDWTYSPYVALHFATVNIDLYDRDGVIWAVNYVDAQKFMPDRFRAVLDREGAQVFTEDLLTEAARSFDELASLSEQPFVVFFEPSSLDDRIANQFAFFSMMSNPGMAMDVWLRRQHSQIAWRRIIIPAKLKWEIRDKLDQANLTERVFFPGMDGLCAWLHRHYSPK